MPKPRAGAGRARTRTPLTRAKVLRAALRIADRDGLDALSMRRLAQRLGVEAMSLYHHVANKEELIDGLVDTVVGEFELPNPNADDWQEAMRRRARSAHGVLMRHPWAPLLLLSRVTVGPNNLAYVDATLGCLRNAGFSFRLADRAWNTIDGHVYGFTLQRLNFPIDPADYASTAAAYLPHLPADRFPHLHALTVEVAEGRHVEVQDFDFGLDMILDGLERLRRHR